MLYFEYNYTAEKMHNLILIKTKFQAKEIILALSSFHTMLCCSFSNFSFKKMLYLKVDLYLRDKMFHFLIYQCPSQGFPVTMSV